MVWEAYQKGLGEKGLVVNEMLDAVYHFHAKPTEVTYSTTYLRALNTDSSCRDLGPVHTYPDRFENANFSFRLQNFLRPHIAA